MLRFIAAVASASGIRYGHGVNAMVCMAAAALIVINVTLVDTYGDPVRELAWLCLTAAAFLTFGITYFFMLTQSLPSSHEDEEAGEVLRFVATRIAARGRLVALKAMDHAFVALSRLADALEFVLSWLITWVVVGFRRLFRGSSRSRRRAKPVILRARYSR